MQSNGLLLIWIVIRPNKIVGLSITTKSPQYFVVKKRVHDEGAQIIKQQTLMTIVIKKTLMTITITIMIYNFFLKKREK